MYNCLNIKNQICNDSDFDQMALIGMDDPNGFLALKRKWTGTHPQDIHCFQNRGILASPAHSLSKLLSS